MPRPRTVPDADVLAAAARVVGRVGPQGTTLALVAAECGLAPATLVQRFGSKRALLLAVARGGDVCADHPPYASRARGRASSPLRALREALLAFARMAGTPEELANHLAFLQVDLADAEFHAITHARMRAQDRELEGLARRAIDAGELRDEVDPVALVRALVTAVNGSLIRWAIYRTGSARSWLGRDIDFILDGARRHR